MLLIVFGTFAAIAVGAAAISSHQRRNRTVESAAFTNSKPDDDAKSFEDGRCVCVRCSWCESHSPEQYGVVEMSLSEKTWIAEVLRAKEELITAARVNLALYFPKELNMLIVDFVSNDLKCRFCELSTMLTEPVFFRSLLGHWADWLNEIGAPEWSTCVKLMTPSSVGCDWFRDRTGRTPMVVRYCHRYVWEVGHRIGRAGIPSMAEFIERGYLKPPLVKLYRAHPNQPFLDEIMSRIFTLSHFLHHTSPTVPNGAIFC